MTTVLERARPAAAGGSAREYWQGVLSAGGFNALPRWCRAPRPDCREHAAAIPGELAAALGRLADALALPLPTLLLAAHAKVLGALSGESALCIGYVLPGGGALPLRLTLAAGSWRDLVQAMAQAEAALLAHRDFPVAELGRELQIAEPWFETLFDPQPGEAGADGDDGELPSACVLRLACRGPTLQLAYRRQAFDDECAARIAGYHLAALAFMAAEPDGEHAASSLLSTDELVFQLQGLAGPRRELPECRVHELIAWQAQVQPAAIAVDHGDERLSYGELDARANRLARRLAASGLAPEGVVAVVCERNLAWVGAVLAIFKAGGAYLPIEPHFPAERIARMLARAGCRLVLSEDGASPTLEQALASLPAVRRLPIADDAAAPDVRFPADDPGIAVGPGQLAYIYFTSGSTGEPKGAMCEHAGMLNHLLAKIADLEIGAASVVAQTAPQCFDISLWQLLAALLVGGRTRLVGQETILDAGRFVDEIAEAGVSVLQLVPSYLEVVLGELERHPRPLPALRYVAVTGEALKPELVARWFASEPGIRLVNAYGLTETSDDTNHEVMAALPEDGRVALGRPVQNVHVYVVDHELAPVPLGAPGEIVFSGVCVGRGYINDLERTQAAFLADPHRPGQRLYRSGDFGRWRADGKLEFLGRRDAQIKISGFRIELGEIESALLRQPGVHDGAVIVAGRAGGDRQLVAFYAGERAHAGERLRRRLAAVLPCYMVPAACHRLPRLPLTDNGKIDRKALALLAEKPDAAAVDRERLQTPGELGLAAAWAAVLGIGLERIGRDADFFALGGTSLTALRLAVRLNRAISLKDLAAHPVLADLARLLEVRALGAAPASPIEGGK